MTCLAATKRAFSGLFIALLLFLCWPSAAAALNILFITRNQPVGTSFWTPQEILRRDLMLGWGHTITPLWSDATQAEFDLAAAGADVAFFGEEIHSPNLGYNPLNSCVGIVNEEDNYSDEFGFSSTSGNFSRTTTFINGVAHYITSGFPIGNLAIFSPADRIHYLSGSIAPGLVTLAYDSSTNNITLAVLDVGAQLYGALGTATSRRVWLPWGASNMDFANVTADGRTLLQRSLEWAAQGTTCSRISKRAFLSDGTPIADGTTLPIGTNIDFLLYINNSGGIENDVRVQDILDPTFLYQNDSMRVDNSQPQCATTPCTSAEESAILAAVKAGTAVSDTPDGDVASAGGGVVNAGDITAGNAQLDIAANRVWALLFTVTIQ